MESLHKSYMESRLHQTGQGQAMPMQSFKIGAMPPSLHRISYKCGILRQNMLNDCLFGIVMV